MIHNTVSLTTNGPRRKGGDRSDALAAFLCQAMEANECGEVVESGVGAPEPARQVGTIDHRNRPPGRRHCGPHPGYCGPAAEAGQS